MKKRLQNAKGKFKNALRYFIQTVKEATTSSNNMFLLAQTSWSDNIKPRFPSGKSNELRYAITLVGERGPSSCPGISLKFGAQNPDSRLITW